MKYRNLVLVALATLSVGILTHDSFANACEYPEEATRIGSDNPGSPNYSCVLYTQNPFYREVYCKKESDGRVSLKVSSYQFYEKKYNVRQVRWVFSRECEYRCYDAVADVISNNKHCRPIDWNPPGDNR